MVTHRFDAIAAQLSSLAAEIAAINAQPLEIRIDLRPEVLTVKNSDAPSERAANALRRFSEAINRELFQFRKGSLSPAIVHWGETFKRMSILDRDMAIAKRVPATTADG